MKQAWSLTLCVTLLSLLAFGGCTTPKYIITPSWLKDWQPAQVVVHSDFDRVWNTANQIFQQEKMKIIEGPYDLGSSSPGGKGFIAFDNSEAGLNMMRNFLSVFGPTAAYVTTECRVEPGEAGVKLTLIPIVRNLPQGSEVASPDNVYYKHAQAIALKIKQTAEIN